MFKSSAINEHPADYVVIPTVAFLYAVTAYLGLFLAVPPGYATAVWIPSGIALGAALVWGLRVLPGVFIGSFIMNYYVSVMVGENLPLFLPFISGIIIAAGATIQTAVGYYLIKKYVGLDNPLTEPKTILLFGFLSGPVASLVNATWSNLSLLAINVLPFENFPLSWVTWWIGDSTGVLIFTPMFLILFSEPRSLWRSRITPILLPLLVSFLGVVIMFFVVYSAEIQHIKTSFDQLLTNSLLKVENEIATNNVSSVSLPNLIRQNFKNKDNFYSIKLYDTHQSGIQTIDYVYLSNQPKPKPDQFIELKRELTFNNGKYFLLASPSNTYINNKISGILWSVLISGLFFSILINTILFIINGQKSIQDDVRFQKILEATPEAIVIYNYDGDIVFANKETERIFAYTKEELLGQSIKRLVPGCDIATNEVINLQLQGYKKNGTEFPIEKTTSQVTIQEGEFTLAVIRDVTERMKLEKLKTDFISVVSHELRTPLTSIQGALSFLTAGMSEYELNQKSSRLLLIAKQNCERLIRLINDILDIDKIESAKNLLHFQSVNIKKLIEDAIKINEPYARNHNIELQFTVLEQDFTINADYDRLIQVLTNLISNAIKFSPSEGVVTISYKKVNNNVRVSVTDLGQGIPEEFKDKIFQKFAQADTTSARKYGGSGLGLNISKSIILKHHGIIDYMVDPKGTTFYFEIPLVNKVEIVPTV